MRSLLIVLTALTISHVNIAQPIPDLEEADRLAVYNSHVKSPRIHGRILNNENADYIGMYVEYSVATLNFSKEKIGSAVIEQDGTFEIKLDHPLSYQEVRLSIDSLYEGKIIAIEELDIVFDLETIKDLPTKNIGDGISFEGKDAEVNIFINQYELFKKERKEDLQEEKLATLLDSSFPRKEKVTRIQKTYKKLAAMERSFAKKNGQKHEWILRNDRIASMYADIFSLYLGSTMSKTLFKECTDFKPFVISNASVQYYDFLSYYLRIPSRIERKIILERTLKEQIPKSKSTAHLGQFLREYEKKREHLKYNTILYQEGKKLYLDLYDEELKIADIQFGLNKFKQLQDTKSLIACAMGQPVSLEERALYLGLVETHFGSSGLTASMKEHYELDKTKVEEINSTEDLAIDSTHSLYTGELPENAYVFSSSYKVPELFSELRTLANNQGAIIEFIANSNKTVREMDCVSFSITRELDSLHMLNLVLYDGRGITKSDWIETVKKSEMSGHHIYLEHQLARQVIEHFQIRSYPAILVMNQRGKVDIEFLNNLSKLELESISSRFQEKQKM